MSARPGGVASAGVADQAGEIPDEENHLVAELLELPHLVEQYRVAQMQVRRRGIEARLHLQRLAPLEFLDQLRADQHLVRATMQLCNLFLESRRHFVNPSPVSVPQGGGSVRNEPEVR